MHCQYCGKDLTNTSPRDSDRVRREDSKFCDDKCRMAYHAARRKYLRKLKMLRQLQQDMHELKQELAYDADELPQLPDDGKDQLRELLAALVRPSV